MTCGYRWRSGPCSCSDTKEAGNRTNLPIYEWKLVVAGNEAGHLCSASKRPLWPDEGANEFNVKQLDNLPTSQTPMAVLIFRGRRGRLWQRASDGEPKLADEAPMKCVHK
jgi:hypothetical protein